ncbi:MAG: 2-oxoacid:acceptor oxidoreductase family protein [Candidatus Thorarchaeota archaeon]|nr:2-oxoacid:acceptor oxidoreductase family protein [Candidatus Thorarchaeota archaeon]
MRNEIRIAGTGGMGVVLAGVIMGNAAIHAGLNVVQSQSYGSEARGTAAKSEIIVSDGDIHYPKVRKSDIFVVMSQKALEMYLEDAKENSILIIDPDLVDVSGIDPGFKVIKVPAMQTADDMGLRLVSNMVMLGALAKTIEMISMDALEKAVTSAVSEKYLEINMKAVKAGADFV